MTSEVFGLDPEERTLLLQLARESIITGLAGGPVPAPAVIPPRLTTLCGAFVTLHRNGKLRGCIGRVKAANPLATTILEMARAAAFSDPRFRPVSLNEVPELELEISVLSPFELIDRSEIGRIVIGVHGLYISGHGRTGLLLPQVAPEWGWDVPEFLGQTCAKAGLETDAWKRDAKIEIFTAEVFGDLS